MSGKVLTRESPGRDPDLGETVEEKPMQGILALWGK
jgi:hypothetical protein